MIGAHGEPAPGRPAATVDVQTFLALIEEGERTSRYTIASTALDLAASAGDRSGRDVADQLLSAWESALRRGTPPDAAVARLGVSEHAIALPGLSPESATLVLNQIRMEFARDASLEGTQSSNVAVGIASRPRLPGANADLLRAALSARARAGREGRGGIAIYVKERMILKNTNYSRARLDRLSKLAAATNRTEAILLREALDDLLMKLGE